MNWKFQNPMAKTIVSRSCCIITVTPCCVIHMLGGRRRLL